MELHQSVVGAPPPRMDPMTHNLPPPEKSLGMSQHMAPPPAPPQMQPMPRPMTHMTAHHQVAHHLQHQLHQPQGISMMHQVSAPVAVHHPHHMMDGGHPKGLLHSGSDMGKMMGSVPHQVPMPQTLHAPPPALHPLPGHPGHPGHSGHHPAHPGVHPGHPSHVQNQMQMQINGPMMPPSVNTPESSLSVFEQAREIKKARHVKNARGPKVFKPVKWDTKLSPDENIKLLPVLRLQKPETHTIGKFAKGGNHFCQLPSCPILAEKASRPLKAGKTKKAQRCKCDFYCEVCMVVLHPFPCFDVYHGRKPHSNALHTDA